MVGVTVLGNQDFRLEPLDPRVVPPNQRTSVKPPLENSKITLKLTSDIIDYGIIRPTNPVIRQGRLEASSSASVDWSIIAFEDHPLLNKTTNEIIPDTSCDDGNCRETVGSFWTNPLAYGFGFSLEDNLFKQFANQETGENKPVITTGRRQQQITMTYKVNVAKTQPNGIYSNTVTYILVPGY